MGLFDARFESYAPSNTPLRPEASAGSTRASYSMCRSAEVALQGFRSVSVHGMAVNRSPTQLPASPLPPRPEQTRGPSGPVAPLPRLEGARREPSNATLSQEARLEATAEAAVPPALAVPHPAAPPAVPHPAWLEALDMAVPRAVPHQAWLEPIPVAARWRAGMKPSPESRAAIGEDDDAGLHPMAASSSEPPPLVDSSTPRLPRLPSSSRNNAVSRHLMRLASSPQPTDDAHSGLTLVASLLRGPAVTPLSPRSEQGATADELQHALQRRPRPWPVAQAHAELG